MHNYYTVMSQDSALEQGSGGLEVLSTPRLIAFMEHTAYLALEKELEIGQTSVGGHISCHHLEPSAIGSQIEIRIINQNQEGKKVHFELEAYENNHLIAKAQHTRSIIHSEKFIHRLHKKS